MRTHTNAFKDEIRKFGRQVSGKIYKYNNYNLIAENDNNIITEDNISLISEQINFNDKEAIDDSLIYSMSIIKNGQLLQSLMKEFDFEAKVDLRVGDILNVQLGLLVNGLFEYLDYGKYIIYSKEYAAETQTWRYVCYDKMLFSMITYKPLNLTYPCTIRDYLIAIADRIGLHFANANDTFPNYNQQILQELFQGQDVTYRDILDKLSEITASNILINDDEELELGYPNETNDTIDETYLKDTNVNFSETFGPINKVALVSDNIQYAAEDSPSIENNGLTQINIIDNIFAFNGDEETIAQNILNQINGLSYSLNDFSTTGICYYDFLDLYSVSVEGNTYKCLLLNDEISIAPGIEEQIFTEKVENSEKEIDNYKTTVMNSKEVSLKINKQEGKIESKVAKNEVISTINQSAEQIQIEANKIDLQGYVTVTDLSGNGTTTINGSNITTGTIDGNQVNVENINASNITSGTISANKISGGTINASSVVLQGVSLGPSVSTLGGWKVDSTRFYSSDAHVTSSIYKNGNVIFGGDYGLIKFDTDPVRITSAHLLLISDTYDASTMASASDTISIRAYNGSIHINSNYGVFAGNNRLDGSSSKNVKENIKEIKQDYIDEIYEEVKIMPFYTFDYKEKYGDKNNFGFIIEDIEDTCLKDVLKINESEDDKSVKHYGPLELNKMNLLLIKELMKKIEILQKRVDDLERKDK